MSMPLSGHTSIQDNHPIPVQLGSEEARAFMREKLDSREWWIVPLFGPSSASLCDDVYRAMYMGDNTGDLGPDGTPDVYHVELLGRYGLVLFKKRRVPADELARIMLDSPESLERRSHAEMVADLENHDYLIVIDPHDGPEDMAIMEGSMLRMCEWAEGRREAPPDTVGRAPIYRTVGAWADRTFPEQTEARLISHLREELDELEHAARDGEDVGDELADIMMLCYSWCYMINVDADLLVRRKFIAIEGTPFAYDETAGHDKMVRDGGE